MKTALFANDALGAAAFAGYDTDQLWNGWAVPLFSSEQAQAIVEAWQRLDGQAGYDAGQDAFFFRGAHDQDEEVEFFPLVERDGGSFYPIGSGSWIWEVVDSAQDEAA